MFTEMFEAQAAALEKATVTTETIGRNQYRFVGADAQTVMDAARKFASGRYGAHVDAVQQYADGRFFVDAKDYGCD